MFWGSFFEKNFCLVFHGGSSFRNFQKNQKIFKISKMPKIVPKSIQTCFEHVLGQIFRNNFFAQCSMDGRVFEKISKKWKSFQKSKNAQNPSQKWPNVFWTSFLSNFFEKLFCPVFHRGSTLRKFSKKSKNFQNSKNAQNRSQKWPNVFWTSFEAIFSKNYFAQSSTEARVFENFQKNQKNFKISKMPKIFPKSVQTCFEHVLGRFFQITYLKTLVGSVRYLITLHKYSVFHYIVELHSAFLNCWPMPNLNTLMRLVRYTLSSYIAKQFPNTKTLLSYTQS